jgi:hypothetical protein
MTNAKVDGFGGFWNISFIIFLIFVLIVLGDGAWTGGFI